MASLRKNKEIFVVHIPSLTFGTKMSIYPSQMIQIALLIIKKVFGTIFAKYFDLLMYFYSSLSQSFQDILRLIIIF